MTPVILSHIFVLGYGPFFVDALMVMLLAVIYLSLTRRLPHWGEPESVGTMAAQRTKASRATVEIGHQNPNSPSAQVHLVDGGHVSLDTP